MDHRAALTEQCKTPIAETSPEQHGSARRAAPPGDAVPRACEQAIFTSQRTPMGQGYRVIAASPGVHAADKAVLTRRAPSHGALLGEGEEASGLLAFPLDERRYCVGASRFAGKEYSGRGGERVWTHLALLDEETFAAFGWNAVRVHAALGAQYSLMANNKLPTSLPRLMAPAWSYSTEPFCSERNDALRRLLHPVLDGGCWIVQGWGADWHVLEWALDAAPAAARRRLALSCGVSYSRERQVQMAVIDAPRSAFAKSVQGHAIHWCNLAEDEPLGPTPFDAWLTYVQVRAIQGRLPGAVRLAGRIEQEFSAASLARVADLSLDADIAARVEGEELDALREKYGNFAAESPLEEELLGNVQDLLKPAENETGEEAPAQ
jgi:hypothetical protein